MKQQTEIGLRLLFIYWLSNKIFTIAGTRNDDCMNFGIRVLGKFIAEYVLICEICMSLWEVFLDEVFVYISGYETILLHVLLLMCV